MGGKKANLFVQTKGGGGGGGGGGVGENQEQGCGRLANEKKKKSGLAAGREKSNFQAGREGGRDKLTNSIEREAHVLTEREKKTQTAKKQKKTKVNIDI